MLSDISGAEAHLQLIPSILKACDPELERRVSRTQPFFALSATLTLYAHDVDEYAEIARLFDFFLAQGAVAPLYLYVAVSRTEERETPMEIRLNSEHADMSYRPSFAERRN